MLFKKMGLLNNESDIIKRSISLKEANYKYIRQLVKAGKQLAIDQQKIIDRYSAQADKARVVYETAKKRIPQMRRAVLHQHITAAIPR